MYSPAKLQSLSDSVIMAWTDIYNGPGDANDQAYAIAVDGSNNVYITGGSIGESSSNDYATIKYNSSGIREWTVRYNGPGNAADEAKAIAVDASGNVYVTGYSFGVNSPDYATIKYDASGTEVWVARFNGTANNDDRANSIAVDNLGNVYVTGMSTGTYDYDYVTIKYNSAGTEVWTAAYNGPGDFIDYACTVAVDDSGNVYTAGWSAGLNGFNDFATVKYNSAGVEKWAARYHGPVEESGDACYDMKVDCAGNVYVTGGSVNVNGDRDYTTIKYNLSGTEEWAAHYNGIEFGFDVALSLAVDCSGNVFVTGKSEGVNSNLDYLTVKYNSAGNEEWTSRYDGPAHLEDGASAIAIDNSGNVYVTGISTGLNSSFDYTSIKYSPSGTEEWVSYFNGAANDEDWSCDIALDGSGNVYVTGYSLNPATAFDYATVKYEQIPVPVEFSSFSINVTGNDVTLNWVTATETNNRGFDIERAEKTGNDPLWVKVGYAAGNGTTTEPMAYTFTNRHVLPGSYAYRLKQIDLDGSFNYSGQVDAEVAVQLQFALSCNYPNPFNPSTQIEYTIPEDAYVTLKVFNTLGQEAVCLVDGLVKAGSHQVTFNASGMSSGVYFYKIESGSKILVKKMMVLK